MDAKHNRRQETLRERVNRLYDKWSLSVVIWMFGVACFAMGAAAAKWYGQTGP